MSKVSLCNSALTLIGEGPNITALEPPDGSAHAQLCATLLDDAVEFVTESRHWTFADKRAALSKVTLANPTASASNDTITTGAAHLLIEGSPVSFYLISNNAVLPAPLVEGTIYYALSLTTTEFTLSDSAGGDEIDLSTAGTGQWGVYKESDRSGSQFMYALPTDCLVERNLVPPGAPDDWPGRDGALLGVPYSGVGVVATSANGLNYSFDGSGFGPARPIPCKRALNAGGEQVLYTNLDAAELVYSSYIDDETQWPPMFKEAVKWKLTAGLAGAIKRDTKLVDWCLGHAQMAISEASRVDSQRAIETEQRRYPWCR